MLSFEITGDTELARALQGLPSRISKEAAFAALVEALLPVVDAAKARAPVESGDLRNSIGFTIKRYTKSKILLGLVGPLRGYGTGGREPANYAHNVEYGHRIAQGGKLDRVDGRKVQRGVFESAGTLAGYVAPRPFLRPAWDETKQHTLATLARVFGEKMLAEVRRRKSTRRSVRTVEAAAEPVTVETA